MISVFVYHETYKLLNFKECTVDLQKHAITQTHKNGKTVVFFYIVLLVTISITQKLVNVTVPVCDLK